MYRKYEIITFQNRVENGGGGWEGLQGQLFIGLNSLLKIHPDLAVCWQLVPTSACILYFS